MKVVALVGQSGTGKSHHAVVVAKKEGMMAIIDDGLLISGNKVVAGSSAKREETRLKSVRRALFTDEAHVRQVREAIEKHNIDSILILGTSEAMCSRIADILSLGKVSKFIHIEQVSSPRDIAMARNLRMSQGKHIIPVPTLEIKKDFYGYFLHPLRLFRRNQGKREEIADKTVVRPTYSYMGDYSISDNALAQMAIYEARRFDGIEKAVASIINRQNGELEVNLTISVKYGSNLKTVCDAISHKIETQIEKTTALYVCRVNIYVKELIMQ